MQLQLFCIISPFGYVKVFTRSAKEHKCQCTTGNILYKKYKKIVRYIYALTLCISFVILHKTVQNKILHQIQYLLNPHLGPDSSIIWTVEICKQNKNLPVSTWGLLWTNEPNAFQPRATRFRWAQSYLSTDHCACVHNNETSLLTPNFAPPVMKTQSPSREASWDGVAHEACIGSLKISSESPRTPRRSIKHRVLNHLDEPTRGRESRLSADLFAIVGIATPGFLRFSSPPSLSRRNWCINYRTSIATASQGGAEVKEKRTALNGAKGCSAGWERRRVLGRMGKVGRGWEGVIRTHYTRQTAITNSTPLVGDNYRAGREATRAGGARRCGCAGKEVSRIRIASLKAAAAAAAPPFVSRWIGERAELSAV